MTEVEAKTKWCPESRIPPDNLQVTGPSANRMQGGDATCLASGCMMWRWYEKTSETENGYCGLAGKP